MTQRDELRAFARYLIEEMRAEGERVDDSSPLAAATITWFLDRYVAKIERALDNYTPAIKVESAIDELEPIGQTMLRGQYNLGQAGQRNIADRVERALMLLYGEA